MTRSDSVRPEPGDGRLHAIMRNPILKSGDMTDNYDKGNSAIMTTNRFLQGKAKILLVMTAASPAAVQAQEVVAPLDKFYLSAGVYQNHTEFGGRWDYDDENRGTNSDYEEDLGFPRFRERLWKAGATFDGAHRLQAFGWHFGEDFTGSAKSSVNLNGNGMIAGGRVEGSLDVDVRGVAYTWFLNRSEKHAFGMGLGAARYHMASEVDFIYSGFPGDFIAENRFNETVDMPMVHAEYVRSFSKEWRAVADVSYLRKPGGGIKGDGAELNAGVEFLPLPHFALALRYNYSRADFDFDRDYPPGIVTYNRKYQGTMHIRNSGLQLYTSIRF